MPQRSEPQAIALITAAEAASRLLKVPPVDELVIVIGDPEIGITVAKVDIVSRSNYIVRRADERPAPIGRVAEAIKSIGAGIEPLLVFRLGRIEGSGMPAWELVEQATITTRYLDGERVVAAFDEAAGDRGKSRAPGRQRGPHDTPTFVRVV